MKFVAILCLTLLATLSRPIDARAGKLERIEFATGGGAHVFSVEIADTEVAREIGLMNRRFMPADRGMLFEFPNEEPVAFWMKNTYIPLDMIFIRRDGTIVSIAANAEPLSETTIPSGGSCIGVVELNGGVAASIGLQPGDKVRHPFFKQ
jgi:uncharacterized membrane protein (UPF0127 family)